jgi:hypothetical protein
MSFKELNPRDQREALRLLAGLTQRAITSPTVVTVARKITNNLRSRDDEGEIRAIWKAIKYGNKDVKGLERGVRYVSDPLPADFFQSPIRTLKSCKLGACAEDCDGHAALAAALAGALGFHVGLRAWGPKSSQEYEHVYACVALPKLNPPSNAREWIGLDTTLEDSAGFGWDPSSGRFLTAVVV